MINTLDNRKHFITTFPHYKNSKTPRSLQSFLIKGNKINENAQTKPKTIDD